MGPPSNKHEDAPSHRPSVLVVEDNFLAALHLEKILHEMGIEVVGPAASVEEGVALAQDAALDAAILDVSIRGGDCFPIAEVLLERACPFLFTTGYKNLGSTLRDWGDVPILHKPIDERLLKRELGALLSCSRS